MFENAIEVGGATGAGPRAGLVGGRVGSAKLLVVVAGVVAVWVALALGVFVGRADAAFGLSVFDGSVDADVGGVAFTRAGGHPYAATTTFEFNSHLDSRGNLAADGGPFRDVGVDLPAGFVGNPRATGMCPRDVYLRSAEDIGFFCPASTQIGVAKVKAANESSSDIVGPPWGLPLYNLTPTAGAVASFGTYVTQLPIVLDAFVSSRGGYHVRVVARDASQSLVVLGSSLTIWGLPSDPSHDFARVCPGSPPTFGCSAEQINTPFLTNPTACTPDGEGLITSLQANTWAAPEVFATASFESHLPPGYSFENPQPRALWGPPQGPTGCGDVPFDPEVSVQPTDTRADAPSGLHVGIAFPTDGLENLAGISQGNLKRARVTLPEGMTISPSAADGLKACTDAEIGIGNDDPVGCPDGSKVGSVEATTPLLSDRLTGAVYVGSQESDDPESGQMFRLFLVVENKQRGLLVKLRGEVRVNPVTGRIETVFDNSPQVPIATIDVNLKGGPRAPLATPASCGPKTVGVELSSWSGQTATRSATINIDCPGTSGFFPLFDAGTVDPTGGAFSPFVVRVERPDRQQYISGVTLAVPGGLAAKLKGVPLCGEAQAAAGSCPAGSRIGTATVGAGPGSNPFFLSGSVSLTGPYKGAPYGLSVAVRAGAGPFDLGMVVVRQAIYVDPIDAHLTVISDPLPAVVKGVPVRLRSVNVDVERPGFTLNPTSCAEKKIAARFHSTENATADQTVRFQAADCATLGFTPRLALRLTGKGQTRDGDHPGLKAVLTQPSHQAGIRSATVRLPLSLALDPQNAASDSLCEFDEGQKPDPKCPKSSIIGHAKATTPLLNRPLQGNVYFVKNVRTDPKTGRKIRTLPTLLLALRGEVSLNVRATTSISHNRLVSTFKTIPDAPVTRFDLNLNGGKHGILVVTTNQNLCAHPQKATTNLTAHNQKHTKPTTTIKTPCKQ